ncbi:hypothetical protein PRZ48_011189 [Zasmidium cellare]|uniref:Guanine nucleotide exchange factor LTE1 n=1 Tax=Zasmidium cellare TaxID=395010 RepID=A0ABR0EB94_ZASCE|nr:hypothetical protein PRZ48_011189 [Zasmidium cellare]
MRWLILERSASTRKRLQKERDKDKANSMAAAIPATRPPIQARRTRPHDAPPQISPVSDKLRRAKDGSGNERPRGHKRADTAPTVGKLSSVEDDQDHSKKFTVANVGAGGTLFLKPTRVAAPHLNYAPATPPATSDGESSVWTDRPLLRESYNSGTWTPRPDRGRMASMAGMPVPPLSLNNANEAFDRRRTRSHSESTVSDRLRLTQYGVNDFALPQDGERTPRRRRRSSADLTRGLVDVHIPHYRLGTPRFSDRGTAYLHYSMVTNSTDGIPSSIISRTEYDKLFPIPPGRGISSFYSHLSAAPSFLHPDRAYSQSNASRTPFESQRPSTVGIITPALFNKLESNLDDPSVVHYHPTTGRIVAATPARLIAQITSPQFLDYELLADFFLTYRCFMQSRDVLDFLFARLRWAFVEGNDAGRIARVRTFVALRHWILNYFQDDFMVDGLFRQNFCDQVNDLCRTLRERPDRGGGDMNIIGELKKCWRRTCALYWPVQDAHEVSPDADIVPGGDAVIPDAHSSLSLPLTIRPTTRSHSIFEVAQIPLPSRPERGLVNANTITMNGADPRSTVTSRTASIPASPMSDQSLEVLSCSVPFLRNLRPTARAREKASPPKTLNNDKNKKTRPARNHKRSGSFSDALRDKRTPLSSPKADNIELKDLPAFAITGGLVRGILLQPSPAKVDNNVPVTPGPPGPELTEARLAGHNDGYFNGQHNGVKKFVGEVRRALSSRKASSGSPSRSAGSGSDTESKGTIRPRGHRRFQPDMQQLPGPDRFDMLGVQIETSYSDAVDHTAKERAKHDKREAALQPAPDSATNKDQVLDEKDLPDTPRAETPRPVTARKDLSVPASKPESVDVMDFGRLNSHNTNVTTGSRSIVIVDATGAPEIPMMSGGLPSLSSMSTDMMPYPLFRDKEYFPPVPPIPNNLKRTSSQPPMTRAGEWDRWRSSDERMHDLLTAPNPWEIQPRLSRSDSQIMRKSSSLMDPSLFEIPRLPRQLRRQPHGDDLRAAHHVHSLHAGIRSRSVDSPRRSMASGSVAHSAVTHTDESTAGGVVLPARMLLEKKSSVSLLNTHSSQPALRPSFVEEAKALRGIPDTDVEGGIEDALLKLEGKIPSPASSNSSDEKDNRSETDSPPGGLPLQEPQEVPLGEEPEGLYIQEVPIGEEPEGLWLEEPLEPPPLLKEMANGDLKMKYSPLASQPSPSGQDSGETPATETQGASIYHLSTSGIQSMSSQTEYPLPFTMTPIDVPPTESSASVLPMTSRLSRFPIPDPYATRRDSSPESFPYERKPESIASISNGHYPSFRPGPWSVDQHGSFLLDDNETLSDISTEIADYRNSEEGVRSFYFDDDDPQPIRPFQPLPTPPSTAAGQGDMSPDRRQLIPRLLPRDPGRPLKEAISQPRLQPQLSNQPFPRANGDVRSNRVSPDTRAYPAHLPFILAYESECIAEQLTIIEKDALDEVDWKDLISLHWSQNPPYVRNWVDYLDKESANGIDIVIARFNLVVKWCISEIVLTDAPSERARAITKFIHIATHCHRMHNYASMYQLTLALLSTDLSRLHRTWSLVALREKQMLEHLERLCRPLRNFYSLRAEMETAFAGNGVIPFIGLYTHDLMFNALKSSRIEVGGGKEPLVNFERYQTAAAVIKNLLRLIEASSKYDFHPEPEALSRCLWIAALDDEEIGRRSRSLEAL